MRKRRVIIFGDNVDVANVLKEYFTLRGYDALTFHEPVSCPLYKNGAECSEVHPCADIVIADLNLPAMNGLDLLRAQSRHGCKVPAANKALMSGDLDYDDARHGTKELGCQYLQKPFIFGEISAWLDAREPFMDLSLPLGTRRQGKRIDCREEVECLIAGHDKPVKGIALNRGPAGLCLKIARRVSAGQAITLHAGPSHSPQTALVRWVVADEDGSSLVGLQYA
ncbi:MAG TPA: response regulator [Nitrospirota bacterium]|nr:response regulator [Nitrospirota bacterium]